MSVFEPAGLSLGQQQGVSPQFPESLCSIFVEGGKHRAAEAGSFKGDDSIGEVTAFVQ